MILLFLYCEQALNLFVLVRVFSTSSCGAVSQALLERHPSCFLQASPKPPQVDFLDPTGPVQTLRNLSLLKHLFALTLLRNC